MPDLDAFLKHHHRLPLDIDPLAVAMCQVNGALYAPWLSFPLPAAVFPAKDQRVLSTYPSCQTH